MVKTYLIILGAAAFIMLLSAGYLYASTRAKNNKFYMSVVLLFLAATLSTVTYMASIGTHNIVYSEIAYSIYFASMDWLLICMMFYARNYTKVWVNNSATPFFVIIIAIIDTVDMLCNNYWHHIFSLKQYFYSNTEWLYQFQPTEFYYVHLVFCYILVVVIVAMFVIKSFSVGGFHKGRYLVVLTIFLSIILGNGIFLMFSFPFDISMLFYAIFAILIGYFSISYNPKAFVEYMLSTITERMDCALVAFDENDSCIYANQLATRIFGASANKQVLDERFRKWRDGRETNIINSCSWNDIYQLNGEESRFDIHFNKIYDKKGYFCGCYFSFYDITSDFVAFEEERYRSSHDQLTGALNRDSFYLEVKQILNAYPTTDYVMICSDIKGFKLINDMFGLDVADKILIKIADVIRERIQAGSTFARLEADRFAVFMPKERYSEELFLRGIREVEYVLNSSQYRMNIQMGVYDVYDRSASAASMCDRAFMAIDSIKENYKDRIAYYGDMLRNEYMNEQKILGEFEAALSEGQFAMFLQPIINRDDKMEIAEALVRWISPEKGIISPGAFVPVLESTGYIYKLDMYMWEQAVKRLSFWGANGKEDTSISVNVSVKDFYYIDIYDTLTELTERYNVNPKRLKLEITESVFMTEKERQIDIICALREYGFIVEIDDFGSGFSSLNMLKEMPADILKIDMAFLSVSENEDKGRKIVNTIIALAKALDMSVVVEGVETAQQVEYLKACGCDLLQGYYYDKPLPVRTFESKYLVD